MIPIHELLNRIRWDPEFAKGDFELGYHDRTENGIIMVLMHLAAWTKKAIDVAAAAAKNKRSKR